MMTRRPASPSPEQSRNEVLLVGRLAAAAQCRALPSGDEIAAFRLIVARGAAPEPGDRPGAARRPAVDTIDCTAWTAALRRRLLDCAEGEHLEVAGALRRRFWAGPGGRTSTYGVEVSGVRRLAGETPGPADGGGTG